MAKSDGKIDVEGWGLRMSYMYLGGAPRKKCWDALGMEHCVIGAKDYEFKTQGTDTDKTMYDLYVTLDESICQMH